MKSPFCLAPAPLRADCRRTLPLRVFRIDPTGIWRASAQRHELDPLLARPRRPVAGTAIRTVPETTAAFTAVPSTGGGGPRAAVPSQTRDTDGIVTVISARSRRTTARPEQG